MKKLILSAIMALSLLVAIPVATVNAQEWGMQERQEHRHRMYHRHWGEHDRWMYTRQEYRYVRVGDRVYKETYDCVYNRYDELMYRRLISRQNMGYYNDYDRNKFKFNVFLNF